MTLTSFELPLSQELLDYYRDRVSTYMDYTNRTVNQYIERSEQDYQDVLKALEAIKLSHEEYHKITWELHQRLNEIADLQKALSDAQNYLFDERKQLLKVVAENDNLRLQELKDRKKIRYLLALQSAPEEQEITYFKDGLEKRFVQRSSSTAPTGRLPSKESKEAEMARFEEEDAQTLRLKVRSLESQLEEQSRLYEEAMEAIKQDQKTTLEECRLRRQYDAAKIEELLEKVKKLQDFSRENTRELIEVKKAHKIFERRSKEERTKMLTDLANSRQRLGEEKGRNDTIETLVETKVSRKNESLISDLRLQVAKYESELMEQKKKQGQVESAYEKRIEALKTRVQSINNSYKTLKKRRDFEIEGFTSDIQNLRRQLKTLEKHILKSGPVEDRELQLLSIARETGEKAAKISGDLHDLKARLYEAEREVQSLPI